MKGKIHRRNWKRGPTKTKKSKRRIGLNDEVIKVLKNLQKMAINPDGLIFPKADDSNLDPDYFDELFDKVRTRAKLRHVRSHDLRHFLASMLIAQGESPKYVCDSSGTPVFR